MKISRRRLAIGGTALALTAGSLGGASIASARNGADDPPRHDARDDHGRHHRHHLHAHVSRHGHDDPPGHDVGDDHGGRGR